MDFIPFEKVSVQEAKAALDGDKAVPPAEKNWAQMRDAGASNNAKLTEQVWVWVDGLPKEVQPENLVRRFPRIAIKLAELWRRPFQCDKYLDALILDQRGSRQGFPLDVAKELALLKTHLNWNASQQKRDVWGERLDE
jgi:hypothetical protein